MSETVFHDVPVRGPGRRVQLRRIQNYIANTIEPDRPLKLAKLRGNGLGALSLRRAEIIEVGSRQYPRTALWAQALHASVEDLDGLVWTSRQNDASIALMLFGDRVGRNELRPAGVLLPLAIGEGLEMVRAVAGNARITVVQG